MSNIQLNDGFTIIELMIAITITAILMAVAIPSYQNFVKNNCLSTTSANLVTAFQLARSEAIKRRTAITVVANPSWNDGWMVQNGSTILNRFYNDGCPQTDIRGTVNQFDYQPNGSVGSTVSWAICDDRDNSLVVSPGKQVRIAITGRPSTVSKYVGPACP